MAIKTAASLRAAARACRAAWFARSVVRFFNVRIHNVYPTADGAIFVSSDRFNAGEPRGYMVRKFVPADCALENLHHARFATHAEAREIARELVGKPTGQPSPKKRLAPPDLLGSRRRRR